MDIFSRLRDFKTQLDQHLEEPNHNNKSIVEAIEILSSKIDILTRHITGLDPVQIVNNNVVMGGEENSFSNGLITIEDEDSEYIPDVKIGKSKGRVTKGASKVSSSNTTDAFDALDKLGV